MRKKLLPICVAVLSLALSACSLIDDDENCSTCKTRTVDCRVHVSTGIDSLLSSQIHGDGSETLLASMTAYYQSLFNAANRSVGFSFYDSATGDLLSSESRTMQGNEATFSISLPDGNLSCVAVSPENTQGEDSLVVTDQPQYSGRQVMQQSQSHYSIHLYPVDAQVALAARIDSTITAVTVSADGNSTAFSLRDSTYHRSGNASTALTLQPSASTSVYSTYTATLFPTVGSTRDVSAFVPGRLTVLATTASGSVTRTVLTVNKPLLPGDIQIFQVSIGSDGAARTNDSSVGASVTLDWKSGGDYNPEI